MTAMVCNVIGTGQNGIWALAAIVISAVPAITTRTFGIGRVVRPRIDRVAASLITHSLNYRLLCESIAK
jgi:hypothetical protein